MARTIGVQCVLRAERERESGTVGRLVAECQPFPYRELGEVELKECRSGLVIALDHVLDPRNVGAIIRTAEAFGALAVILPVDRAAPVTAEVERASAGATATLPIVRVVNLPRALDELKSKGFWVVALDRRGEESLFKAQLPQKMIWVLGGEEGMGRLVMARADHVVAIPTVGKVESLNVSVAAGIAMFAWVTQNPPTASNC